MFNGIQIRGSEKDFYKVKTEVANGATPNIETTFSALKRLIMICEYTTTNEVATICRLRVNDIATEVYNTQMTSAYESTLGTFFRGGETSFRMPSPSDFPTDKHYLHMTLDVLTQTYIMGTGWRGLTREASYTFAGQLDSTESISKLKLFISSGSINSGTMTIYGVRA